MPKLSEILNKTGKHKESKGRNSAIKKGNEDKNYKINKEPNKDNGEIERDSWKEKNKMKKEKKIK